MMSGKSLLAGVLVAMEVQRSGRAICHRSQVLRMRVAKSLRGLLLFRDAGRDTERSRASLCRVELLFSEGGRVQLPPGMVRNSRPVTV